MPPAKPFAQDQADPLNLPGLDCHRLQPEILLMTVEHIELVTPLTLKHRHKKIEYARMVHRERHAILLLYCVPGQKRSSTSQKHFPEAPYKARAQAPAPSVCGPAAGPGFGQRVPRHTLRAFRRAARLGPCARPWLPAPTLWTSLGRNPARPRTAHFQGWPHSPAAAGPETGLGPYAASPGCTPRARLSHMTVPPGRPRSVRSGLGPFLGPWPVPGAGLIVQGPGRFVHSSARALGLGAQASTAPKKAISAWASARVR